jgi:four helix bundle protein
LKIWRCDDLVIEGKVDAEELKIRTKRFAIEIIQFVQVLPKSDEIKIINGQLVRAATSVAANYRAACRSRSKNEFYAKICIVVEESDESLFWLEVIEEAKLGEGEKLQNLIKESKELVQIFSSTRKTLKQNL